MKLKFKKQEYQAQAVKVVIDCFKGQPNTDGIRYGIDPGVDDRQATILGSGFKNTELTLGEDQILENIRETQRIQNLPVCNSLVKLKISPINLDIEMETVHKAGRC